MTKPELDLGMDVIRYTFEKLPPEAKVRIVEELEKETWADRLNTVVSKIRRRVKQQGITDKEIDLICEQVRKERYARNQGRN